MDVKSIFEDFKKDDFCEVVNLHMHTNCSDGLSTPENLVDIACKKYKYFSITDHNSMDAYKLECVKNCNNIITGIEFDCWHRGVLTHILGYGVDVNNSELNNLCAKTKKGKEATLLRLIEARNPKKVINAIRNSGGIAVLAHPACYWCINLDSFVYSLVKFGIQGIEVYYPYHNLRGIVKFHSKTSVEKIADKYSLIKTGGTDEHGFLE